MNIIEQSYKWNGSLSKRLSTKYIILHHRAGNGDVQSIHQTHLANGWSGIGYHFYVRKDGSVYLGRPIDTSVHTVPERTVKVLVFVLRGIILLRILCRISSCRQVKNLFYILRQFTSMLRLKNIVILNILHALVITSHLRK